MADFAEFAACAVKTFSHARETMGTLNEDMLAASAAKLAVVQNACHLLVADINYKQNLRLPVSKELPVYDC